MATTAQTMETDTGRRRFQVVVDVHLLLVRGDEILLGRRQNTGFGDGAYHPPAGHMESDESVVQALVRETKEEIGISVSEEDLELAHVMHNSSGGGRLAFFFVVRRWSGDVMNMEPDKCSEWRWFPLGQLPNHMIDYARAALTYWRSGVRMSMYEWRR